MLATYSREDPVPVPLLLELFHGAGVAPSEAWIEFHRAFAGYWEPLGGGEVAVWGLAVERGTGLYFQPRTLSFGRRSDADGQPDRVFCADVHPSHDYYLKRDGEFVGLPFRSQSFWTKVERDAIEWSVMAERGRATSVRTERGSVPQLHGETLVVEASDAFARYYLSPSSLVLEVLWPKPWFRVSSWG